MVVEHVTGEMAIEPIGPTVAHTLRALQLPTTLFQAYAVTGTDLTPIPPWSTYDTLRASADHVVIRALRNTLFDTIISHDPHPTAETVELGTGFESIVQGSDGRAEVKRSTVTPEQARRMVSEQVKTFVQETGTAERGCVFGVSGGGDSNALAYGLKESLPADRLTAFTLTFRDVMTDAAADRASVLCQDLGIEHTVYTPERLAALLGMTTSLDAFFADFGRAFGHEAVHFFGTFLILKTARVLGQARAFSDLAFGYNREDLLAELLFMVMNGHQPLEYPVRQMGGQRLVMPVWRVPKLLLDACHPAFSLENYRERDPHTTRQRSLAFYLAHSLDSAYPSFGLSLLDGMRRTFAGRFASLHYDETMDVHLTVQATPERREMVRQILDRHFRSGEPSH
ncbi:hypothetical protein [Lentzea aerocolonigenes]|uniref:hypothetical protein n=1 Tax=Lentzea aerocolonigenes TaxID=68170 RepID=UPI00138E1E86|nr:hypothetical protein [Lentzea aerocolonigenes]